MREFCSARGTKEAIFCVARDAFGARGFHGVSVRFLAQASGTNVSAINYHFGGKSQHFNYVLQKSYRDMEQELAAMAESRFMSTEVFAQEMFAIFVRKRKGMLSIFRILLGEQSLFDNQTKRLCEQGPPGHWVFRALLEKECPHLSGIELLWGVRSLFSMSLHMAIFFELHQGRDESSASKSWSYPILLNLIGIQAKRVALPHCPQ